MFRTGWIEGGWCLRSGRKGMWMNVWMHTSQESWMELKINAMSAETSILGVGESLL